MEHTQRKTSHPLAATYDGMIARCHRTYATNYPWYGGLGIQVCQRWRDNFWCFVLDMGNKPGPDFWLSRIDDTQDYTPDNTVWKLRSEAKGRPAGTLKLHERRPTAKRVQVLHTYQGKQYTLRELAELSGHNYHSLVDRHARGWSVDRMVETPINQAMSEKAVADRSRRVLALKEAAKYGQQ